METHNEQHAPLIEFKNLLFMLRPLGKSVFNTLSTVIFKVKNEALQAFLTAIISNSSNVFDIMTDADKHNVEQLSQWWESNKQEIKKQLIAVIEAI